MGNVNNTQSCYSARFGSEKIDEQLKENINDEHSFILEVFGIYQLQYRWFKAVKLIVFDQTSHFSIVDRKEVIMRFEIRMKKSNSQLKISAKRLEKLKQIVSNIKAGKQHLNQSLD